MSELPTTALRCPACGAVLRLKANLAPERVAKCPKCATANKIKDYIRVKLVQKPRVAASLVYNGTAYTLAHGRNIVGRRADSSKATLQLDDPTRHMSREHFVIDIDTNVAGTLCGRISAAKESLSTTLVDGRRLGCTPVEIADGSQVTILAGDTTISFTIKL